jgi:hypothetical protein
MIDRSLIDPTSLVNLLLDTVVGNVNHWWRLVEIVPDYMPPFPNADTRPTIAVRCLVDETAPEPGPRIATGRFAYLRTGGISGWKFGGYFWDQYGTPFPTVEFALMAAIHAPVPPQLLRPIAWRDQ